MKGSGLAREVNAYTRERAINSDGVVIANSAFGRHSRKVTFLPFITEAEA